METPGRIPFWVRARSLRAESTDAERRLWGALRARRLMGWRFRRQQPIGPYIVDFVCIERRLIVEVDGSQHREAIRYDTARDWFLCRRGFVVMRFWNSDVLTQTAAVLEKICAVSQLRRPSPPPSPACAGEGVCGPNAPASACAGEGVCGPNAPASASAREGAWSGSISGSATDTGLGAFPADARPGRGSGNSSPRRSAKRTGRHWDPASGRRC